MVSMKRHVVARVGSSMAVVVAKPVRDLRSLDWNNAGFHYVGIVSRKKAGMATIWGEFFLQILHGHTLIWCGRTLVPSCL